HVCRMGIVRMVGVDQTWSDPNAFASSLLLALVFVPVLWRAYPSRRMRQCLAGYVLLAFFCILRTGSRGAFLGLLIWAVVTIWRSPWRARLIPLALAASPLLWFALPEELQNRFLTIVNPEAGPANAQVSGQQRIEGLLIGLELWQQNPLTGIGPGAWRVATGRPIESHNLYGQLMGEMGTFGILTFGSILLAFALNLWRIRSVYRRHPEWGSDFLSDLSAAVGLAIFLLLFEGNFGHNLFRYNYV